MTRCNICGAPTDTCPIYWEKWVDHVCGPCFGWAMRTLKRVVMGGWYGADKD